MQMFLIVDNLPIHHPFHYFSCKYTLSPVHYHSPRIVIKCPMQLRHEILQDCITRTGRKRALVTPIVPHQLPSTSSSCNLRAPICLCTRQDPNVFRSVKVIPNMAPKCRLLMWPFPTPPPAAWIARFVGTILPRLKEFVGTRTLLRDNKASIDKCATVPITVVRCVWIERHGN